MISAIIICRSNSSRFPNKHLSLIGKKFLLEIILDNLLTYKKINEIYIGTGPQKINKIYYDKIKKLKKFKNIKFHFENNDEDVTGRINQICKKISNEYTLVISGDCPLIDISLIKRLFNQLNKKKNADFVRSKKKIIHEGIKLFKTNAWQKVNNLSTKKNEKEHPGYIISKKKKKFRITYYKPQKYEQKKICRLSVDTKSDLIFFQKIFKILKSNYKEFNVKNLVKLNIKYLSKLNSHVVQKKPTNDKIKKINIFTETNSLIGKGHFSRSISLFNEIEANMNVNLNFYLINSKKFLYATNKKNIIKINDFNLNKFNKSNLNIIDVSKNTLKKIKKKTNFNNPSYLFIDNKKILKKNFDYFPSPFPVKRNNKIVFKKIIISRQVNHENLMKRKKTIKYLFVSSGSYQLTNKVISFIKDNIKSTLIILGPFIKKKVINDLKKINANFVINPDNIFEIMSKAKFIIIRYGILFYETLSLKSIPVLLKVDESHQRSHEIDYFIKEKLAFNFENFRKQKKHKNYKLKNIEFDYSMTILINLIKRIIKFK